MNFRRRLVQVFTFLGGIYFFLEFVLPKQFSLPGVGTVVLDTYHEAITNGFVVVGAMAVGLGLINLLSVHGSRIVFKRKDWLDSLALLLGLFVMMWVTTSDWISTRSVASEVERIFVLRDFATLIKDQASPAPPAPADQESAEGAAAPEPPPAPKLPVGERNAALAGAARLLFGELDGKLASLRQTGLSPQDPDSKVLSAYEGEAARQLAAARAALASLSTGADPDLQKNAEAAAALNALGVAWQDVLNLRYRHSSGHQFYLLLYDGLFVSLGSAMFSLLGFYIAAAAYRAFRIRSAESGLMMAAALVVMLGQIPFGIWIWEGFPDVRLWLLSVPSGAAFRAIKIGAEVAGLVIAFRMWFSLESEYFTGEK